MVAEVHGFLLDRAATALAAGVTEVWVDPGIGFGKTQGAQSRAAAPPAASSPPTAFRYWSGRAASGSSGLIAPEPDGSPAPVGERLEASLATATWAMLAGRFDGAGPRRRSDRAGRRLSSGDVKGRDLREFSERGQRAEMRGKWAAGIPPRNFTWVIQDQLAMSERPGGFAPHHRRVRRQEEIIWLRVQGFTRIVSMLPSPHNLQAYEQGEIASAHFPVPASGDVARSAPGTVPPARRVAAQRGSASSSTKRSSATASSGFWRASCSGPAGCPPGPDDRGDRAAVGAPARAERARARLAGRRPEAPRGQHSERSSG